MRNGRTGWENGARVPIWEDEAEPMPPRRDPAALVMARRLVGFLLADTNPALGIECMAVVTGIGYDGSSLSAIAKRHKVTRAAVSKRCVELCDGFGIPPVRAMRPAPSRARCRMARAKELAAR